MTFPLMREFRLADKDCCDLAVLRGRRWVPWILGKHEEVEMDDKGLNQRIELAAARIAIDWKNLFASELHAAAQRLATGSQLVTTEHYWRALPAATASMLRAINTCSTESSDAKREIA
jgi:hypothetical protein